MSQDCEINQSKKKEKVFELVKGLKEKAGVCSPVSIMRWPQAALVQSGRRRVESVLPL